MYVTNTLYTLCSNIRLQKETCFVTTALTGALHCELHENGGPTFSFHK